MLSTTRTMITTQSSSITIINNGWVIKNNASDQPCPKGGDSLHQTWDNLSEIWNHPAVLMQWPIPPKSFTVELWQTYCPRRAWEWVAETHGFPVMGTVLAWVGKSNTVPIPMVPAWQNPYPCSTLGVLDGGAVSLRDGRGTGEGHLKMVGSR